MGDSKGRGIMVKPSDYGKFPLYCKSPKFRSFGHIKSHCDSTSSAPAGIGKRGDVYNTHFTKAVQLGDWLKTPNPIALRTLYCPSPSETATLGIAWLSRTSAKAIVEAADTRSESKSQDYSSSAGVISSGSRDISDLSG